MNEREEKYSLDYFKGVFHTYAIQNDPGVNVGYYFDINDFSIKNTIEEALKKEFCQFQEFDLEFTEITQEDFEELLNRWLYSEFFPNYKNYIPTSTVTKQLVEELIICFKISSFYKVLSIKRQGENAENEFGYATDFVILSSTIQRYFCEFTLG